MRTLGYYSYLLIGFVLWASVTLGITHIDVLPTWGRVALSLLVASGLIGLWLVIRPTETQTAHTAEDAEKLLGAGKPVVLEFFSEY